MSINQRITEIINIMFAGNKRAFSTHVGVSPAVIENIVGKRQSSPSFEVTNKILLSIDNISAAWLMVGAGKMTKEKDNLPVATKITEMSNVGIPLIPIEAMAGFGQGDSQVMEYECERYIIPAFRDAEFLIQVKGSSMYPKYSSGDIVACKKLPLDTFFQWNKVYVVDTEQGALIKRVKKGTNDNCILLVSENPSYEPFDLPKQQINSIALVVGVIRLE